MCGINGFISRNRLADASRRIQNMNRALYHRGPDAGGCRELIPGHAVIGHRRLSIIDLDARANQPMFSASGRSVIVFNGEIYNYQALRRELPYPFSTASDTEVLLAGLELHGIDWLRRCNGMFAFAFCDLASGTFVLARDRLGIKPLYYYQDPNCFVFSSEIKGILSSGLVEARWNADAVDEYLGNRYIREPYTFFENILQVPAGCCLTVGRDGPARVTRYWDLPDAFNMADSFDEQEIFEGFRGEVREAIHRRMISDVPLGAYLSGGIDSSIISAVCAEKSSKPVQTYTIGFPSLNEFSYAREVADQYHTNHHEILIDDSDYFGALKELITYKDAPLGVPNEVPLAIMSKELKKGITVVLSGEGADELMGGYGRIFRAPFDFAHSDAGQEKDFYDYFVSRYEYVPRELRDRFLRTGRRLREENDARIRGEFHGRANEENVFRFFHRYHVKGLLQRVDITTMYASVEARVPFLDHELVEFTYDRIPYGLKLKWHSEASRAQACAQHAAEYSEVLDTPKYLLRRMGLELLPEEVVTRRKVGFPVPLNNWFEELSRMAADLLRDAGWFRCEELNGLIEDCRRNPRSGQILWMFVNTELFRRLYFEKDWRY